MNIYMNLKKNGQNNFLINIIVSLSSIPYQFFDIDFKQSRLFGAAPDDVIEILRSEAVTPNFHTFCLTRKVSTGQS